MFYILGNMLICFRYESGINILIQLSKKVNKLISQTQWVDRHLHVYLVSMATALGGQDKSWQVARQLQPSEVPHKVPEDDGVLIDNTRRGDGLVTLIHQQALQLLPQNQRAQVGHRHRSRGEG